MYRFVSSLCSLLAITACSPSGSSLSPPPDNNRSINIALRSGAAQDYGTYGQGEYPLGKPLPQEITQDGIRIGTQLLSNAGFALLKKSGHIPFRQEMSDQELLESFTPELRSRHEDDLKAIVDEVHNALVKLHKGPHIPSPTENWFSLPSGVLPENAQSSYDQYFTADGSLRDKDLFWRNTPTRGMLSWAAAYQSTKEEKWAHAVITMMEYYYHNVRPPAEKIRHNPYTSNEQEARRRGITWRNYTWRTLNMGASTPAYLRAYLAICDWPGLTDEHKTNFLKGAIERGQFLHFTTTPAFPWLKYNRFGYANWLLYQLQGELAVATIFPCFTQSKKWLQHATDGIVLQSDWVVQPDGSHDEFSYDYAAQVASQLTNSYLTLRKHNVPISENLARNIFRLNEGFLELFNPGNQKIPFGDSHRGSSLIGGRMQWASVLFLDPRFKRISDPVDARFLSPLARILSPSHPEKWIDAYESLTPAPFPEKTSSILPDVGWSILRSGWSEHDNVLALAYRGSDKVAHSAREHLGLNIWVKGAPLMVKFQGEKSYSSGYPKGYLNTPRVANMVMLYDAAGNLLPFKRETGTLRNWHTSSTFDYIDADHLGWFNGKIRARRRVLFLKPDWVFIIDDIDKAEGTTSLPAVTAQWQAHIGPKAAAIKGHRATWQQSSANGTAFFLDATPEQEQLTIEGSGSTTHLLKAHLEQNNFPIRFTTLMHLGGDDGLTQWNQPKIASDGVYDSITLPFQNDARTLFWETAQTAGDGRFLGCSSGLEPLSNVLFAASDEGALPPALLSNVQKITKERGGSWNGRVVHTSSKSHGVSHIPRDDRKINDFRQLTWSGQPQIHSTICRLTRFVWETSDPAVHSLLYRATGEKQWRRALAPGLHREAWVLVPDLLPKKSYELQAVAEFPDGTVSRSNVLNVAP